MSETEAPEADNELLGIYPLTGCIDPKCECDRSGHVFAAFKNVFREHAFRSLARNNQHPSAVPTTVAGLMVVAIATALRHPEWGQAVVSIACEDAELAATFPTLIEGMLLQLPVEVRDGE